MYKDIELTMTDQRDQCVDWLLLQSIGHRNSAAMTCGHLSGADRVIASRGNQMVLHFHTAARSVSISSLAPSYLTTDGLQRGDEEQSSDMKGFKIFIQGACCYKHTVLQWIMIIIIDHDYSVQSCRCCSFYACYLFCFLLNISHLLSHYANHLACVITRVITTIIIII